MLQRRVAGCCWRASWNAPCHPFHLINSDQRAERAGPMYSSYGSAKERVWSRKGTSVYRKIGSLPAPIEKGRGLEMVEEQRGVRRKLSESEAASVGPSSPSQTSPRLSPGCSGFTNHNMRDGPNAPLVHSAEHVSWPFVNRPPFGIRTSARPTIEHSATTVYKGVGSEYGHTFARSDAIGGW